MTAPGKAGLYFVDHSLGYVVDALAFQEAAHLGRGRFVPQGCQGLTYGMGRADELFVLGERPPFGMGVPVGVRPGVDGFRTASIL